jgi:hydrogenase nickel incorporation protein HypB
MPEPIKEKVQSRIVQVERDILAKNDAIAANNRAYFATRNMLALNLVSSPGSGKTMLLVRTITALNSVLKGGFNQSGHPDLVEEHGKVVPVGRQFHREGPVRFFSEIAVIEGDQQTDNDAERIRATGVQAIQINTGKGCHLDAEMVSHALDMLDLQETVLLFIENVGNLVCPAAFDLGEAAKVVVLSVTEGEDKPLKYPEMFRAARLMLLNKCDLLPYVTFDVAQVMANAKRVNPDIEIIQLSGTTGAGMDEWLAWLAHAQQAEAVA